LADAVAGNVDADTKSLGQRIILPSSFAGSTCHMQQLLQDALAINDYFKSGNLFLTMTANPAWPEIQDEPSKGRLQLIAQIWLFMHSMQSRRE
jgi:hypothetical protein